MYKVIRPSNPVFVPLKPSEFVSVFGNDIRNDLTRMHSTVVPNGIVAYIIDRLRNALLLDREGGLGTKKITTKTLGQHLFDLAHAPILPAIIETLQTIRDSARLGAQLVQLIPSNTITKMITNPAQLKDWVQHRHEAYASSKDGNLVGNADAEMTTSLLLTNKIDKSQYYLARNSTLGSELRKLFTVIESEILERGGVPKDNSTNVKENSVDLWIGTGEMLLYLMITSLVTDPIQWESFVDQSINLGTPTGLQQRGQFLEDLTTLCQGLLNVPLLVYLRLSIEAFKKYALMFNLPMNSPLISKLEADIESEVLKYDIFNTGEFAQGVSNWYTDAVFDNVHGMMLDDMMKINASDIENQIGQIRDTLLKPASVSNPDFRDGVVYMDSKLRNLMLAPPFGETFRIFKITDLLELSNAYRDKLELLFSTLGITTRFYMSETSISRVKGKLTASGFMAASRRTWSHAPGYVSRPEVDSKRHFVVGTILNTADATELVSSRLNAVYGSAKNINFLVRAQYHQQETNPFDENDPIINTVSVVDSLGLYDDELRKMAINAIGKNWNGVYPSTFMPGSATYTVGSIGEYITIITSSVMGLNDTLIEDLLSVEATGRIIATFLSSIGLIFRFNKVDPRMKVIDKRWNALEDPIAGYGLPWGLNYSELKRFIVPNYKSKIEHNLVQVKLYRLKEGGQFWFAPLQMVPGLHISGDLNESQWPIMTALPSLAGDNDNKNGTTFKFTVEGPGLAHMFRLQPKNISLNGIPSFRFNHQFIFNNDDVCVMAYKGFTDVGDTNAPDVLVKRREWSGLETTVNLFRFTLPPVMTQAETQPVIEETVMEEIAEASESIGKMADNANEAIQALGSEVKEKSPEATTPAETALAEPNAPKEGKKKKKKEKPEDEEKEA